MAHETLYQATSMQLVKSDGFLLLSLLPHSASPFTLGPETFHELSEALNLIEENHADAVGLIIRGGEGGIWCAGADIDALASCRAESAVDALIVRGQSVFNRIQDLPIPTLAAIHGSCVGGGLELALACDLRIASDAPRTQLGLPEVKLGILPAWGGTTRLVETTGLRAALPLLLTGKPVSGRRARAIGLVAACCPVALMDQEARQLLQELAAARGHGHHGKPQFRRIGLRDYLVYEIPFIRNLVLDSAEKRLRKQGGEHYPAPLAILSVLRTSSGMSRAKKLSIERETARHLALGSAARNLISVFRRNRDSERGAPYDARDLRASKIDSVAVVGGGVTGSGLATALLTADRSVVLVDTDPEALLRAHGAIVAELDRRVSRRQLTRYTARLILDRLILTDDMKDIAGSPLIIESATEEAAAKKVILADIAEHAAKGAVICTNTSCLSISDLAGALPGRRRLYGLHFFNPVPRMPLVEIVRGPQATDKTLARLARFCRSLGKTPVIVEDRPAFVVNRLLAPYFMEALRLLRDGAPLRAIESAARNFGLPVGPFELMDSIGLDLVCRVCESLGAHTDPGVEPPALLEALAAQGRLGQKSGSGFYRWSRRHRRLRPDRIFHKLAGVRPELQDWPEPVILRRLTDSLATEAERILDEKVVGNADDLDLASIYGMGFPPFTGGVATWQASAQEARA